jgi:hypothetical protein
MGRPDRCNRSRRRAIVWCGAASPPAAWGRGQNGFERSGHAVFRRTKRLLTPRASMVEEPAAPMRPAFLRGRSRAKGHRRPGPETACQRDPPKAEDTVKFPLPLLRALRTLDRPAAPDAAALRSSGAIPQNSAGCSESGSRFRVRARVTQGIGAGEPIHSVRNRLSWARKRSPGVGRRRSHQREAAGMSL